MFRQFPDVFQSSYKALLWVQQYPEGIKIIPKTSKKSREYPEMNKKVKLAIKSQQLARNMKKNKKKNFLKFTFLRVSKSSPKPAKIAE